MVSGLSNANGQNIGGISRIMSIPIEFTEPGGTLRSIFLKGLCEYRLGNLKNAFECISHVIQTAQLSDDGAYEKAIAFYIEGKLNQYSPDKIKKTLELLYPSVYEKVISDLSDPKTVLDKVYPVCNGFDCESCSICGKCRYPSVREVSRKIWKLVNAYNPSEEEILNTFKR